MGFIPPQIERHGLSGLYLTALLTAIAAVLAVTGAGSVLVFVVNATVKHIAIRDQSICILDATLRIVPGFAVLFMFSACGVFLSLFFITVVGSLFGIIDLFLVALVLSMWRGNPHRWEYGRDDMFDIDSVYVFFIHTMATCLWPIHLFRLIGMPSWSPSFEALATSFINTYSHYIQTAYFTTRKLYAHRLLVHDRLRLRDDSLVRRLGRRVSRPVCRSSVLPGPVRWKNG